VFLHALIFKGLEDFRKGGKMTVSDRFFRSRTRAQNEVYHGRRI
jgi:hypothetical protein